VVDGAFAARGAHLSGAFFTLTIGETLVAANFFLRGQTVLHDWIMAYNPAFEAYSPGMQLGRMAVEWAAEQGVAEVDFGPGDYQYKRQLATGQRILAWGALTRPSLSGIARSASFALRAGVEKLPQARVAALAGKAMRRFDLMRALAAPAR